MQRKMSSLGYSPVLLNAPYGGGFILKWLGTKFPHAFVFSMEINKVLYMSADRLRSIQERIDKIRSRQYTGPATFLDQILTTITLARPLVDATSKRDRDLASQLRRALSSVALNLAEGFGTRAGNARLGFETAHGIRGRCPFNDRRSSSAEGHYI